VALNNRKLLMALIITGLPYTASAQSIKFTESWRYWHSGTDNVQLKDSAEIVSYDSYSSNIYVTSSKGLKLDVLSPTTGAKISSIDLSSYGSPNSVATYGGTVAVAVEADTKTDNGKVVFFNASTGAFQKSITVGALPDMLTFTKDGKNLIVANEGESKKGIDPEGSVSIIDMSNGVANATVATAGFSSFNADRAALKSNGVRIFDNADSVAQDLEPEYIATAGGKAYVTLQENNSLAIVDIATNTVTDIISFGTKDHSLAGNGLDASDKQDEGNIQNYNLKGLFQPDAIAAYEVDGKTYLVTANEGDARKEDERMINANLDSAVNLIEDGRIQISTIDGDTDGDGDIDIPHSYGARSFSIWDDHGSLVFDSGDTLEQLTINEGTFIEKRSDNKGPEPEGVTIGLVDDKFLAFIGLERAGGVAVFDITLPEKPLFIDYLLSNMDVGPEGLTFVSATDSNDGNPFLLIANEISGTTVRYNISAVPLPATFLMLAPALAGFIRLRRKAQSTVI